MSYKIIRFFLLSKEQETIETGLSLEEAQKHCSDPETSSSTCESEEMLNYTDIHGPWFDGYTEE